MMDYRISSFIIALLLIAFFASSMTIFMFAIEDKYGAGTLGNNSIAKYNHTAALLEDTKEMRDATNISQKEGLLDIIGGYFSSGWSAVRTAGNSVGLFEEIASDLSDDIEFMGRYNIMTYLKMVVVIIVIVGIFIALLLKWKT